jgi:hypothetical protein
MVPKTLLGDVKFKLTVFPEHTCWLGNALTVGIGLTVKVYVLLAPVQVNALFV